VTTVAKIQLSLEFDPALTEQFRTLKQCLCAVVYGSRIGLSGVASHCDLSPSALSRMLNENEDDPRHLPVDLLPRIIEATGDLRPIHWLNAKFVPDEATRQRASIARLESLIPEVTNALAALKRPTR
jgi:hypothetical protein